MKNILFFLLVALSCFACKDDDEPTLNTPACIQEKIQEYIANGAFCDDDRVVEYKFQDNIVYAFEPGSCIADAGTDVFTDRCDALCFVGGFGGIKECNGDDFYADAEEIRVIFPE